MIRIILFIILLAATVTGQTVHVITSLPATITPDMNGGIVRFNTTPMSAPANALTIASGVQNVVIDGQGTTIYFGTDGNTVPVPTNAGGDKGIVIMDGTSNVTIKNLKVLHNPPEALKNDVSVVVRAMAIRFGAGSVGYIIDSCTFRVYGTNSIIAFADNNTPVYGRTSHNNMFYKCVFVDSCHAFERRDYWEEQTMLNFAHNNYARSKTPTTFEYHWRISHCSTAVAFWSNLHLEGDSTVAIIDSNYFTGDGWNTMNGTPYAHASMTTAAENYAIACRASNQAAFPEGVRIKIYGNRFVAGENHAGQRGIFISGVEGIDYTDDNQCIAIYENYFYVHQGYDGYSNTMIALIVRDDWARIRIHHNYIEVKCYANAPNGSYGDGPACGLRLTCQYGHQLYFAHNTVKVYFQDAFTFNSFTDDRGQWATCIMSEATETSSYELIIDSNTFITNNIFISWGFFNGHGGGQTYRGNTFQYYGGGTSPNNTNTYTGYFHRTSGSETNHAFPNYLVDTKFQNGIQDNHFRMDASDPDSMGVFVQYTLTPRVIDNIGNPIRRCTVEVTNNYGANFGKAITDQFGRASFLVTKYYEANEVINSGQDSADYNPFTIRVAKFTSTNTIVHTLTWDNKAPDIVLAGQVGEDSLVLVKDRPEDSALTSGQFFNPLAIPRFQIAPLRGAGDVVIYKGASNGSEGLSVTKNVDSIPRWVDGDPVNPTGSDLDHAHISVYKDTILIGNMENVAGSPVPAYAGDILGYTFDYNTNTLVKLWNTDWGYPPGSLNFFVAAAFQLPDPYSDTAIAISRGYDDEFSIRWYLSTNRARNFTDMGFMVPRQGTGRVRIGMMYDWDHLSNCNTVAAIVDSGDYSIEWWSFNRQTRSFFQAGQAFNRTMFRGFAANTFEDTIRVMCGSVDNTSPREFYLTAWDNAKLSTPGTVRAFNEITPTTGSVSTHSSPPYVALTYIEASKRLVRFWTKSDYSTTDSCKIYCDYWVKGENRWSTPPTLVSYNSIANWKVTTATRVPASHGDVAYCLTDQARIHGGSRYGMVGFYAVVFGDSTKGSAPAPVEYVDSTITIADVSVNEAAGIAEVIVKFSPQPQGDLTYTIGTTNGTATSPGDFTGFTGLTATMYLGSTEDTINIAIVNDTDDEPNETFTFTVSNPSITRYGSGAGTDMTAIITIIDNDVPPPTGQQFLIGRIRQK